MNLGESHKVLLKHWTLFHKLIRQTELEVFAHCFGEIKKVPESVWQTIRLRLPEEESDKKWKRAPGSEVEFCDIFFDLVYPAINPRLIVFGARFHSIAGLLGKPQEQAQAYVYCRAKDESPVPKAVELLASEIGQWEMPEGFEIGSEDGYLYVHEFPAVDDLDTLTVEGRLTEMIAAPVVTAFRWVQAHESDLKRIAKLLS